MVEEEIPTCLLQNGRINSIQGLKLKIQILAWTKEKILKNIEILMRSKFTEPKEAFDFYDEDKDGFLTKNDFKNLLKEANVSILICGLFAEFMLQSFDKNGDELVDWQEFQAAILETNLRK